MGERGPIASVTPLPGVTPKREPVRRVQLSPGAPNPPTTLCAEAKAEWRRLVPDLDAQGLLAKVDRAVLTTWCDAWAKHERARRILDVEGLVVEGAKGDVKHPAWMVYSQTGALLAQLAKELFASPNARLRSQLPKGDDGQTEGEGILD